MKRLPSLRLCMVWLMACALLMPLSSCYEHNHRAKLPFNISERQKDSLSFFSTHHYTNNYNFIVKDDSFKLMSAMPEELISGMHTDSFFVYKNAHLVVADIRILPADSIDSVWVQLANDSSAFGWTHENAMLKSVEPDDPISHFISEFSDTHVIIFIVIIVIIGAGYLLRSLFRRNARIVHFNDIDSFYPTLLCLIVATAAAFYAGIQTFSPQMWQHFYFHPTLNPFSVPMPLGIFLSLVWAMLFVALAVVDDIRHHLPLGEAVLYLGGLAAICAVDYIVFSVTSLFFVGYVLLVAYYYFALHQYFTRNHAHYICGKCGAKLRKKGVCPHCGTLNV